MHGLLTSHIVPLPRSDKLSVVCVSDHEYPPRVAHTMMQRIGEDFAGEKLSLNLRAGKEEFICHRSDRPIPVDWGRAGGWI